MKPCGKFHPHPCGVDAQCEVPVEYFDSSKSSEEIWKEYTGAFE